MRSVFVFLALVFAPWYAMADTPCETGAKLVYSLVELRDAGYKLEDVELAMRSKDLAGEIAPWTPDAVTLMARVVYKHTEMDKRELAVGFYAQCSQPRVTI